MGTIRKYMQTEKERKRTGKKEKEKDLRTDPGGILFFKDLKNRAER